MKVFSTLTLRRWMVANLTLQKGRKQNMEGSKRDGIVTPLILFEIISLKLPKVKEEKGILVQFSIIWSQWLHSYSAPFQKFLPITQSAKSAKCAHSLPFAKLGTYTMTV